MICILMAGLRIMSPYLRHSEKVSSIQNLLKDSLNRAGEMSIVLVFDICNVYEMSLIIGCIHSIEVG